MPGHPRRRPSGGAPGRHDGQLVDLAEAAAICFPHGPLTAKSLSRAAARGELEVTTLRCRLHTTILAVEGMAAIAIRGPERPGPDATERLLARLTAMRKRRGGIISA